MQKIRQEENCGLGKNIRKMRIAAGLTQDEITAQMQLRGCDISRSIYSQIECESYNIRVCELIALKQILKTDYNAFFDGLEEDE